MGLFAEDRANYVLGVGTNKTERLILKRTSRETGESDAVELRRCIHVNALLVLGREGFLQGTTAGARDASQ